MNETVKYYLHGTVLVFLCCIFSLALNIYAVDIISFHYPLGVAFAIFVGAFCFPYIVGLVNALICKYLWYKELRLNVWFNGFFLFLLVSTYKLFFDLFFPYTHTGYIALLVIFPYALAYLSNNYVVGEE